MIRFRVKKTLKQLKRTQANVSLWGLLMASKEHREARMSALQAVAVSVNVTLVQVVGLVSVTKNFFLTFFFSGKIPNCLKRLGNGLMLFRFPLLVDWAFI